MHINKFTSNFDPLKMQITAHSIGEKFVFFGNEELQSPITQVAICILKSGEFIPFHSHETMEEVFYIISGNGTFYIGDEIFHVENNTCIRVPAGFLHSIKANIDLHFYYFGVATNQK